MSDKKKDAPQAPEEHPETAAETEAPQGGPPPVAGEEQEADDPTVIGELSAQENGVLRQIQHQSQGITMQIGQTEIRKAGLLGALQNLENQSEQLLQGVAKRLGIQQGTMWRVSSDGKARLVPGMGGTGIGMPVQQPQLQVVPQQQQQQPPEGQEKPKEE